MARRADGHWYERVPLLPTDLGIPSRGRGHLNVSQLDFHDRRVIAFLFHQHSEPIVNGLQYRLFVSVE